LAAADSNKSITQLRGNSRKIEKWSDIISQLNIDVSKPINYVTAKQIKKITNEDARLMAKMDRIESLPRVFKENNLFLLPISRKEYTIVRGMGYHNLEKIIDLKPIMYTASLPFPTSTLKAESEGVLEWKYKLTDRGEEFLRLPSQQKSQYICKLLLEFPIINEIFLDVSIDPSKVIGKQTIIRLLKKYSLLSGSTLGRRAQTIISWFKWIRNNVGIVEVNHNGEIRISRETRINN
jgi:hypothetical protein